MQQVQIQAPAAPGQPVIATIQSPAGVPQTQAEYRALILKRSELSDQLVSAANRRKSLAEQLKSSDPSARAGIEDRLRVLDARIVKLETEIDRTGDLVANAPPHVMSGTTITAESVARGMNEDIVIPIAGMLSVFVLFPLTLVFCRYIWKRSSAPAGPVAADHATQQRLEQIQQSVDTIAIEVERISEGQRFVTKMMSERDRAVGAGAGAPEPIRSAKKAAVSAERG